MLAKSIMLMSLAHERSRASMLAQSITLMSLAHPMMASIHAGREHNAHVPSASMIESTHAGQEHNAHVPSASMIESIHAGQDNSVHVPRQQRHQKMASFRELLFGHVQRSSSKACNNSTTGPLRCHPKLSSIASIFGKLHDLQNKPYNAQTLQTYGILLLLFFFS